MELPPNPGGDKGFITEGVDVLHGKRKSTLTDVESVKAQRLQTHARRAGTPEYTKQLGDDDRPTAFYNPPVPNPEVDFTLLPGGDLRRVHINRPWMTTDPFFFLGPGPYMPPQYPNLFSTRTVLYPASTISRPSTITGNDLSTLCVIS